MRSYSDDFLTRKRKFIADCDHPGCVAQVSADTRAEVASQMLDAGWHTVDGHDLCADHSPEGSE